MSSNTENGPGKQQTDASELVRLRVLHKIDRARSRLLVCFYTLPLYIIALLVLLNQGRRITLIMFVYMSVYAVFAIDMVVKQCPVCREQFFVKRFFLNFFTRKCVHCGTFYRKYQAGAEEKQGKKF